MIALLALAAYQALSSMKQADDIRMSAELTSKLNEVNAKYTETDAYDAEKFGYTESAAYQTQIDQAIGAQRTAFAANDVDVSFGTAAEVQKESSLTGALNIIDIQNRARAKAMGIKQQADNMRIASGVQKDQARLNADATQNAGIANAAQTGFRGYTQSSPDGLKAGALGSSNYTRK